MDIRVLQGDVLEIAADVLVLKYAQAPYGVDNIVVDRLEAAGIAVRNTLPKPDGYKLIDTRGQLTAKCVLFVGVVGLRDFGYEAIREFSKRALSSLVIGKPSASHVALTLHGAGYGLDELEAFRAELAGILDAVEIGDSPPEIKLVTIIERNPSRARRLQTFLRRSLQTRPPSQLSTRVTSGLRAGQLLVSAPLQPARLNGYDPPGPSPWRSLMFLWRCILRQNSTMHSTTAFINQ